MNKSQAASSNSSMNTHSRIQKSTILKRQYVKRPIISIEGPLRNVLQVSASSIITEPPKTEIIHKVTEITITAPDEETGDTPAEISEAFAEPETGAETQSEPDLPPEPHPYQKIINEVTAANLSEERSEEDIPPRTPRELKNEAIRKALDNLEKQQEEVAVDEIITDEKTTKKIADTTVPDTPHRQDRRPRRNKSLLSRAFRQEKRHSSVSKFILAFATSAACIGVLGYFVSLNMPSISVRVAAMQTGIEASYPNYIPRDFQLSSVSTDNENAITMTFSASEGRSFTLYEEKSSWDSNALLTNYVKVHYNEDYTTLHEQGITIYLDNAEASWVNGGILYRLNFSGSGLTKKLIKNIALSL